MISINKIKDILTDKGFVIKNENPFQDVIIRLEINFSNGSVRKNLEFSDHSLDYIKEIVHLLEIVYPSHYNGQSDINYPSNIYNSYDNKDIPLLSKEIFKDVDIKYWPHTEVLLHIEEYIKKEGTFAMWDPTSKYGKYLGYYLALEYPKITVKFETK